jgi:DegV family protein with EDD domain
VFEAAFAPLVESGAAVLCFTITSRHSGTYSSAWAAAQRFPGRVLVWDSRSLSVGMGLQLLEAARLVREGLSCWEVVRRVAEVRRNSRLTILLDTVEYLRRGGRVQGAIKVLESLVRILNVRPLLRMVDGELRVLGAARSFRLGLARLRGEARAAQPLYRLAVGHTRRPEEAVGLAEEIARECALPAHAVLVAEVGPALASHGGPGLLGIVSVSRGC